MFPFFRRFKKFFTVHYESARKQRYKLVTKLNVLLNRDFLEGSLRIARINLKASGY